MVKSVNDKATMDLVAKMTGIMLILFAVMRIVTFFIADQVFPFLPYPYAQLIPLGESILFTLLGLVFLKCYK